MDEAAAEWLTCRGVSSAGKLYFMRSTCCAVSWQSPKNPALAATAIFYLSLPSYDSRARQTTEPVSALRVVSGCRLYQVAGLSRCLSVCISVSALHLSFHNFKFPCSFSSLANYSCTFFATKYGGSSPIAVPAPQRKLYS